MINSFDEWLDCITNKCKINLDKEFAKKRLEVLTNPMMEETKKFKELYGDKHLENVIHWYKQIL